ncbi:integrase, partial [Pseudoalteromonas sp. NBT06-2]
MTIKKIDSGFLVDIRPDGRNGKRYRKKFDTKAEALKFEKFILSQHHNKDWLEKPKDTRRISELIPIWYMHNNLSF